MAQKVVSTKLTEEEYGKLVGLCSSTGYTVSRLLKRAILERMNEETQGVEKPPQPKGEPPKPTYTKKIVQPTTTSEEDKFLYY